jgi:hypothetical protein
MGIVPLGHACVGVTQVRRDHRQRRARLQEVRRIGMAQDVKGGRRVNPGPATGVAQRAMLVRPSPRRPVRSGKDQRGTELAGDVPLEQRDAILRQHDMAWAARLARTYTHGARFAVEIRAPKGDDLAVAAAGCD